MIFKIASIFEVTFQEFPHEKVNNFLSHISNTNQRKCHTVSQVQSYYQSQKSFRMRCLYESKHEHFPTFDFLVQVTCDKCHKYICHPSQRRRGPLRDEVGSNFPLSQATGGGTTQDFLANNSFNGWLLTASSLARV